MYSCLCAFGSSVPVVPGGTEAWGASGDGPGGVALGIIPNNCASGLGVVLESDDAGVIVCPGRPKGTAGMPGFVAAGTAE